MEPGRDLLSPSIKKHTLLAGLAGAVLGLILSLLTVYGAMESLSPVGRFQLGVLLAMVVSGLIYYLQVYVSGGSRGVRLYLETFLSLSIMEFSLWAILYDVLS
ncbi:MAG: hypothetical protein F7C81_05110 [Desulfurococcales archaeon]|nr:hypothetical protein [Desulfurococcales archaeon]